VVGVAALLAFADLNHGCLLDLPDDNTCYNDYCQVVVRDNSYMIESLRLRQNPGTFATLPRFPRLCQKSLQRTAGLAATPLAWSRQYSFTGWGFGVEC